MKKTNRHFLSIKKRFNRFAIVLSVSLIFAFSVTQFFAGNIREQERKIYSEYQLFPEYWNELKELDRVLYSYAQLPQTENMEAYRTMLEQLYSDAEELAGETERAEMYDLMKLTEKYINTAGDLLEAKTAEERLSLYNTLNEYIWLSEGMYESLSQVIQNYLTGKQSSLYALQRRNNLRIILLEFVIIIGFIIWNRSMSIRLTGPILDLTGQAEEITNGNRYIELNYHMPAYDELDILNNAFYKMTETNNQNYEQLKKQGELEKRLAQTRLRLLQSRVNPHFMFNTLNMIAGMAVEEDAENTTEIVIQTAKYLRYALVCLDKPVCLSDELNNVETYMNIQKQRFDDRFTFSIEEDENCRDCVIPSMILQPLCENALEHGMAPVRKQTHISVHVKAMNPYLVITVMDDGAGMKPDRLAELHNRLNDIEHYDDTQGIGTANTYYRIKQFFELLYDNEQIRSKTVLKNIKEKSELVKFTIESDPMICTKICFTMPLVRTELSGIQAVFAEDNV